MHVQIELKRTPQVSPSVRKKMENRSDVLWRLWAETSDVLGGGVTVVDRRFFTHFNEAHVQSEFILTLDIEREAAALIKREIFLFRNINRVQGDSASNNILK